jgi:aspartate racemase
MKRIGLIGGLSWHSTSVYYQYINEEVNRRLGKQHSADLVMISLDFEALLEPWQKGRWAETLSPIKKAVNQLEKSGADFFLVASNAVHKFSDQLQSSAHIPMLHIGKVVSQEVQDKNIKKVGFLGTKVSAESDFYRHPLEEKGVALLLPTGEEQQVLDKLIFSELTQGVVSKKAYSEVKKIISHLKNRGAEGVILGCTELPLLLRGQPLEIVLFDSLQIHAVAAVNQSLNS